VDDEALVAAALRRALAPDHDVTVVTSGRAALGFLRQGQSFEAIVSDLLMPELTGMELHDEVARIDPELASRIVFMTGGAYTGAARAFADRMGDRVIAKPFDVGTLRSAVAARVRR
jgi:CheY-like chemotaxis protein